MLFDAVRREASDIHFDPQGAKTRVRFRMDGSLRTVAEIESGTYREMEYYLKSIAGISGIERAPRNGRIDMEHRGKTYSFRCETAYNYVHDGSKIIYELYCLDEDDQEMIYRAVRNGDNVEKLRPAFKEKYGSPGLGERVVKLSKEGLISGLDAVKYI